MTLDDAVGGAQRIYFGAELSPNSGYMVMPIPLYNVTGDMASGFELDLGSCAQGSTPVVMQFMFFPISAPAACPYFRLTPHSAYTSIRYLDCNNVPHRADGMVMSLKPWGECDDPSVPYGPWPADGAIHVPLSTSLEWSFNIPACGDISGRDDKIYFGTTPNPPLIEEYWGGASYPLQPLQPSTTYYWKVHTRAYGLAGTSPVWSFTTTAPVATQQTSWGAIKALYR